MQLNMTSNKTGAVVDFRGKGRLQVLEGLAVSWMVSGPQPSRSRMASRSDWSARIGTWEHRPLMGQGEVQSRAVVSSRLLPGAGTWHSLSASDSNAVEDTYMAPFRTIANGRWRHWYVPASSQEVCRRLGILDFREAVSMLHGCGP